MAAGGNPTRVVQIKEDVKHIFKDFWDRGVHGGNWYGDTHILYQLGTSPAMTDHRGIVTNAGQGGKHAEKILIDKLENRQWNQCNKISLSMHMNRSPCGDCAESLIGFKNRLEGKGYDIEITIKAAQPYNCKRRTCGQCCEDTSNNDGLRDLNQNDISVNAWDWFDWQVLAAHLNRSLFLGNELVTVDYEETLPGGGHGKFESRSMADDAARQDFDGFRMDALAVQMSMSNQRHLGNHHGSISYQQTSHITNYPAPDYGIHPSVIPNVLQLNTQTQAQTRMQPPSTLRSAPYQSFHDPCVIPTVPQLSTQTQAQTRMQPPSTPIIAPYQSIVYDPNNLYPHHTQHYSKHY